MLDSDEYSLHSLLYPSDSRLIGGTQKSIKATWEAGQGIIAIVTDTKIDLDLRSLVTSEVDSTWVPEWPEASGHCSLSFSYFSFLR